MRGQFINWGCAGPALISLGIAIAIVAGAITLENRAHHVRTVPPAKRSAMSGDARARELARCQSLGRKAQDDPACIAAWAQNRKRFFGVAPAPGKASKR